jgi:uncharacterized protein (TIGR03905 family)
MYHYKTQGTCSRAIDIDARDGVIAQVRFTDGCDGNTEGISRLVVGMKVEDAIARLEGVQCRNGTSCPDQLAKALKAMPRG